jgi:hypothetical protein
VFQAGVDDIFRLMGLVGLRNEAVALVEQADEFARHAGE